MTDKGMGNSVILNGKSGSKKPETVVGFDCEKYNRRKKTLAKKKKQVAGYRKACAEGRVGRPPTKSKDIEQAIELYKSDACTISQITALTGVSKTTLYRVLKEQKVGSPEG